MNFSDIIKQEEPIIVINNKFVPVITDDKRIQNRLFLIQPDYIPIVQSNYKYIPPPAPRFEISSILDIIRKIKDEEDDDSSIELNEEDDFSDYSGFPSSDDEDYLDNNEEGDWHD
tara:strand:+ start:2782 stop:3126 length:345 start_codon:yes stop_codon:yes gene_type:complete